MVRSLHGIRKVLDELCIAADHELDYLQIEDELGRIMLITEDPDNNERFVFGLYENVEASLAGEYVHLYPNLTPLNVVGLVDGFFLTEV